MNVLHTSDWHLGHVLCGKKRYEEFDAFLSWLVAVLDEHCIDVLVVAGDIFDTTTPTPRALNLYFDALSKISKTRCRHVVIVAGNHDSAALLNAPQALLKALNIHVIGHKSDCAADDVLDLKDHHGAVELIVCAVPYLRDRDIRRVEAGESVGDKDQKIQDGICAHYDTLARLAAQKQAALGGQIPILATGHLFAAGGQVTDGDGMRDLYVGSLGYISAAAFSDCFTYVALGHLHRPQCVGGKDHIRYSGAPLPMGFSESQHGKSVTLVQFQGLNVSISVLPVPVFQRLLQIQGDWAQINQQITAIQGETEKIWVEIIHTGRDIIADLRDRLDRLTAGTSVEILRIKTISVSPILRSLSMDQESLADLSVEDVFRRCLDSRQIPSEQRDELLRTFQEAHLSLLSSPANG